MLSNVLHVVCIVLAVILALNAGLLVVLIVDHIRAEVNKRKTDAKAALRAKKEKEAATFDFFATPFKGGFDDTGELMIRGVGLAERAQELIREMDKKNDDKNMMVYAEEI